MAKLKPSPDQPNIGRASLPKVARPSMRRKPWRKFGSRIYRLDKDPMGSDGPGEPPDDFVNGKTSASEWVLYWAMCKIHPGSVIDPRVGPYEGDHNGIWGYQIYFPILGVTGKTNVDFVYYGGGFFVGIRSQSERHHLMTDPGQHALDEWLMGHNFGLDLVVDVVEQDFLSDKSGAAACAVMAQACAGIQNQGPLRKGNTFRVVRE